MPDNQELLKTIRERYRYGFEKWRKNREDGQKNMRYVAGDPWDQADKDARKGRPTVCPDELNQYVNQVVNTARQNPRGVKVDPAGDSATEELAQYRENRIRAIEYACNGAQVYIQGLQSAVERNIGYWKVSRVYVSDESDEQEIVILPVMNPDTIIIDPDYKELDGSDIKWAFELDRIPLADFKDEYPDAQVSSFRAEDYGDDAAYWCDDDTVLIASYWVVETKSTKVRSRTAKVRSIKQYVTNGLEILQEGDVQPGPYIPIIPVFGKEIWVSFNDGGNAERVLLSLVTLARDPQKALAYVMSAMLENMGQIPRTSWVGPVGAFETDAEAWATSNTQYHAYLQYDMVTDATGGPSAPPSRTPLTPDFQAYSTGVDVCRRAIMSAMGLQALPSAAQRANQKSGVALDKIESQQSIGSYHLVDNYDRAIKLTGRIINHWLSITDVGETEKPVREADGTHKVVKVNTDAPVQVDDHQYHFPIADDQGRYQITISDGPSHESQREAASEFVDTLLQNPKDLPLTQLQAAQVLALCIRLKQLGPIGDQMADIIAPKDNSQQQLGQLHQQMQQQAAQMQEMQTALQKLLLEKQGKVIEMQGKAHLAMLDHVAAMTEADKDRETKIAVAEINTKAQNVAERHQSYDDLQAQFHDQAHDAAMQSTQQSHEQQMAQQAAQNQQAAQAQQGQQQSAQSAQEFEQQQAAAPPSGETANG
jgi:hypothetical protein